MNTNTLARLFSASADMFIGILAAWADTETTPRLFVPGDYQNWNPTNAPALNPVPDSLGKYEGYVNLTGTGLQYFKFTSAPDWVHVNYGNSGGGKLDTDGKAGGLNVPDGGYYNLTADLNANKWTATKTEWSIIGNATPGGWEKDTPMTFDPAKQVWSVTTDMKKAGSFKFRANKDWKIDFGVNEAGDLQYVDNPFFKYNPSLKDLTVAEDGAYTITLDLHIAGKYTYSLQKANSP